MGITLRGRLGLAGATDHPHAARRLREAGTHIEWMELRRDDEAAFPVVALITDPAVPEGAFDVIVSARPARVELRGGPFSGVIAGVESTLLPAALSGGTLPIGQTRDRPALEHRTFWTWDHSSNWDLAQIGAQETGVFNPYGKPPEGFLRDYTAMVDFCSRNRISAIVVYGFLRDSHHGTESFAQLCRYANERGVRIVPGIAIGAYGGVYWEGDHPANLATWLRRHPEHAASLHGGVGFTIADLDFPLSFPRSDYTLAACPSDPETLRWMRDSVSWLAETFEIGGINIESGDYGVCGCDRCARRRGIAENETWSHDDLLTNFAPIEQAARAHRENLWITCELQWDNLLDPAQHRHVGLPDEAIYQHTANRSYFAQLERELTPARLAELPYRKNALRLHLGSQWNGDLRTERYAFVAPDFARAASLAARSGMKGLTVWGEASPYAGANEFNYLAFAHFGLRGATTSWESFESEELAPRLGGPEAAREFIDALTTLDTHPSTARLRSLRERVRGHASRVQGGSVGDRWWRLADRVDRAQFTADPDSFDILIV